MVDGFNTNTFSKFDMIKFAKDIMKEIEDIRSYKSINNDKTIPGQNLPVESRINAFFRLIGLPMFVNIENVNKKNNENKSEERHLTPGFFGAFFDKYTIKDTSKNNIAEKLSIRENELNKIENNIGSDELNQRMARALRSSLPIVPNAPLNKISTKGGIIAKDTKFERYIFKKTFPLITSYINVLPKRNEVARPFASSNYKEIDNKTPLPRPFIETVVRIRVVESENAGNNKQKEKNNDVNNSLKSIIGNEEFKKIISNNNTIFDALRSTNTLESFIVIKLFQSIFQLADRWYKLQNMQEIMFKKIPYNISIKTTSAKRSFFGKRANVSADLILSDKSEISKKIKKLNELIAKEEFLQTLLPSNDVIGVSNNKSTAFGSLINSFTSLTSSTLDQLKKQSQDIENSIKRKIQEVDRLRVELEMMTGEFNGLSIVDIISIITALFIIDKEKLIALLDINAIEEMKKDNTFKSAIETMNNIGTFDNAYEAVLELEKIVSFVFDMFNFINESIVNRKIRTKKIQPNNSRKKKEDVEFYMNDDISEYTSVQNDNEG